ncbi:MAG: hypothetical protein QXQ20_09105 [Candidatus Nezhaarchaeales archaeon]
MEVVNENYENLDVAAPAGRDFSSLNTPPAGGAGGATTAPSIANGRYVNSAEDLVLYTDTDQKEYPLFIAANREVYVKKRPKDVTATFYVKNVSKTDVELKHDLLNTSISIIKELTGEEAVMERLEIVYEVYVGDRERLVGEAKAYAIRIITCYTPYSGAKFGRAKAWAIGFDWKKRIAAREPRLEKYVYIKGEEGRKGRAYVRVVVKLPVVTDEFVKLFNMALTSATATQVSPVVADLEEQVKKLEELIKQKEAELQALREQLQQLKLKLQLEQMKMKMVE